MRVFYMYWALTAVALKGNASVKAEHKLRRAVARLRVPKTNYKLFPALDAGTGCVGQVGTKSFKR